MSNMTYCMFENTYKDLADCYEKLYDQDLQDLSDTERRYAERLIKLCKRISDAVGEEAF